MPAPERDQFRLGAGLLERLPRPVQLDLLDAVRGQHGHLHPVQFSCHAAPLPGPRQGTHRRTTVSDVPARTQSRGEPPAGAPPRAAACSPDGWSPAPGSRTPCGSPGSWSPTAAGSRSSTCPRPGTTPPASSASSSGEIHAAGLAADCELTLPADRLGPAAAAGRRGWGWPSSWRRPAVGRLPPTPRPASSSPPGSPTPRRAAGRSPAGRVRLTERARRRRRSRVRALPQRPHGRRRPSGRSPPRTGG